MYPGSSVSLQGVSSVQTSGQSFQPMSGGKQMRQETSQTRVIMPNTKFTVRRLACSEMASTNKSGLLQGEEAVEQTQEEMGLLKLVCSTHCLTNTPSTNKDLIYWQFPCQK